MDVVVDLVDINAKSECKKTPTPNAPSSGRNNMKSAKFVYKSMKRFHTNKLILGIMMATYNYLEYLAF